MAWADTHDVASFLKRDSGYRDEAKSAKPEDHGDAERVSITTLDQYFHTKNRENARVDFLKMDVEVGELAVLRGAKQFLTDNNEIVLMFECTRQVCLCAGHTQEDVFNFLRELGFGLYGWDAKQKTWNVDPAHLMSVGNIWACRDKTSLPFSKSM
jgi:hypothetical protein